MISSTSTTLDYPTSSTTSTGKDVLFFATEAASPYSDRAHDVAVEIRDESDWRWKYHHHVIRNMEICTESPEACLAIAQAGLDRLYETFLYKGTSLHKALQPQTKQQQQQHNAAADDDKSSLFFETGTIAGQGHLPLSISSTKSSSNNNHDHLELPLGTTTNNHQKKIKVLLQGKEVLTKLDEWAQRGVVEPDTAKAIRNLQSQDLNLQLSDWVFVVMGAGAAMGPLPTLLSLGAHVIAVDLPIPAVWERLITLAKSSPGTLSFPMTKQKTTTINANNTNPASSLSTSEREMADRAGCNLLTQIEELRDWLIQQCPDKRLVLGSYAYLDSSAFVRVSLAMDAVASGCMEARPNSALAYLCSPTDCFAIPMEARMASHENYRKGIHHGQVLQKLLKCVDHSSNSSTSTTKRPQQPQSQPRFLQPNIAGNPQHAKLPLVDALVLQQGPNYYLAKRLQHWRAMMTQKKFPDAVVSSNVAPASNTQSVLKNKLLGVAFAAAHHIPPIEIFDPDTSNVLMTYLLLHDLKDQSQKSSKQQQQQHPLELFATTPVHNGIWRCGYQIRSCLELVVAYHFLEKYQPHVLVALLTATAAGFGALTFTSNL